MFKLRISDWSSVHLCRKSWLLAATCEFVEPCGCQLSTTNLHLDLLLRPQKSSIWSFLCHKTSPAWPGKQILFIQAIFKAARSFLCHKMSGEQILFYQGSPILRLGDEFARCGWLGQINQIETPADDQCDTDKGKSDWKYLLISLGPLKIIDISSDLFLLCRIGCPEKHFFFNFAYAS